MTPSQKAALEWVDSLGRGPWANNHASTLAQWVRELQAKNEINKRCHQDELNAVAKYDYKTATENIKYWQHRASEYNDKIKEIEMNDAIRREDHMNACKKIDILESRIKYLEEKLGVALEIMGEAREMLGVFEDTGGHDGLQGKGYLAVLDHIDEFTKVALSKLAEER